MFRAEAISRIQQGLGFRTDLEDEILLALEEAQREFEIGVTLPWFLVQEDQTILTVPATRGIDFPTGFLRLVEDEGPYYDSADEGISYLAIRPYDEALKYYEEFDSGAPRALAIRKASFAVFPLPDIEYSITLSYYRSCTCLDTNTETGWLLYFPDMLLNRAGMLVAENLEHSVSYEKFERKYTFWRQKYLTEIAARENQNMPRMMGVNQ
jgi:hypothetical protein